MKITENEVEVVKHQSVIAPLLLFLFAPLRHALSSPHPPTPRHRCPQSLLM